VAASHSKARKSSLALEFPSKAGRQDLTDSMVLNVSQKKFIFTGSENTRLPGL
jgi:hypothetical protein